jgi:hypothetical protein
VSEALEKKDRYLRGLPRYLEAGWNWVRRRTRHSLGTGTEDIVSASYLYVFKLLVMAGILMNDFVKKGVILRAPKTRTFYLSNLYGVVPLYLTRHSTGFRIPCGGLLCRGDCRLNTYVEQITYFVHPPPVFNVIEPISYKVVLPNTARSGGSHRSSDPC